MKNVILTILMIGILWSSKLFAFENGNKVCMVGNSITHTGRYFGYVVNFYATRYPNTFIEFYNCGIGGDNASKILKRLDKDVFSKNPDWVTLKTGMNDSNYPTDSATQNNTFNTYKSNYIKILDEFKKRNLKVLLISPSIYDETLKGVETPAMVGRNNLLKRFVELDKELAPKFGYKFVDFWTPLQKINSLKQTKDSTFTIIGPDRVHPKEPGHLIMTYSLLKVLDVNPIVSNIDINSNSKKKFRVENGKLTKLCVGKGEITFNFLASALPYIIPDAAKVALEYVPFMNELNTEGLKIRGLEKGMYDLFIDNVLVGSYSEAELNLGVNLAGNNKTPQYKQAVEVCKAGDKFRNKCTDRQNISYVEYNYLQSQNINDISTAKIYITEQLKNKLIKINYATFYLENIDRIKEIENEIVNLRQEIYKINKPIEHKYKLVKH